LLSEEFAARSHQQIGFVEAHLPYG